MNYNRQLEEIAAIHLNRNMSSQKDGPWSHAMSQAHHIQACTQHTDEIVFHDIRNPSRARLENKGMTERQMTGRKTEKSPVCMVKLGAGDVHYAVECCKLYETQKHKLGIMK